MNVNVVFAFDTTAEFALAVTLASWPTVISWPDAVPESNALPSESYVEIA